MALERSNSLVSDPHPDWLCFRFQDCVLDGVRIPFHRVYNAEDYDSFQKELKALLRLIMSNEKKPAVDTEVSQTTTTFSDCLGTSPDETSSPDPTGQGGTPNNTFRSSLFHPAREDPSSLESGGSPRLHPAKNRSDSHSGPKDTVPMQANGYLTPGSVSSTSTFKTNKPQKPDTTRGQYFGKMKIVKRTIVRRPNRRKPVKGESKGGVKSKPKKK